MPPRVQAAVLAARPSFPVACQSRRVERWSFRAFPAGFGAQGGPKKCTPPKFFRAEIRVLLRRPVLCYRLAPQPSPLALFDQILFRLRELAPALELDRAVG